MTCFSIQKSSFFSLLAAFFLLLTAVPATATTPQLNPDGTKMTEEQVRASRKVDAPIVIELYTASDCAACILADKLLYDAMKDKNVIALSCHINDLNNSIEESNKDEATATEDQNKMNGPMDPCLFRQWTYKSSNATRDVTINIPQFIFNGGTNTGVDNLPLFYEALNGYHYSPRNKTLEVFMQWKDKDTITINLPQDSVKRLDPVTASVWLVRYKDMSVEKINAGVNQGKVLRFSNIVQDIKHIGKWHGMTRSIDVDVPKLTGGKNRGGYAVLVQEVMGGEMLAAGKLDDYPMPNDLKRSVDAQTARPMTMDRPDATAPEAVTPDTAPKTP